MPFYFKLMLNLHCIVVFTACKREEVLRNASRHSTTWQQAFIKHFKPQTWVKVMQLYNDDTFVGNDETWWRLSPVTCCDRQAEESEGLPQSLQPSVSYTHTVETHWRGTATYSFGLPQQKQTKKKDFRSWISKIMLTCFPLTPVLRRNQQH